MNALDPTLLKEATPTPNTTTRPATGRRATLADVARELGHNIKEGMNLCPFHNDKTPSMSATLDKGEGVFKCFGCGSHGGPFAYVKATLKTDDQGAKEWLRNHFPQTTTPNATPTTSDELRRKQRRDTILKNTKSIKTVLAAGVPPVKWIVDNIIPERTMAMIAGEPGCYKSTAAQDMALAIARGAAWLGQFDCVAGTVLYVDEENGEVGLARKFEQLVKGQDITECPEGIFVTVYQGIQIDTEEGEDALRALIEEHRPIIVILDSMVRLMCGDEDKAKEVRRVFDTIKTLMEDYGVAFLALHHLRKGDRKSGRDISDVRGSGDFAAMVDVALLLSKNGPGKIRFEIVKHRYLSLDDLQPWDVRVENPGDFETSIKLNYHGLTSRPTSVAEKAAEAIKEWIQKNGIRTFKRSQVLNQLKVKGHSRNAVDDALVLLDQNNSLTKNTRGEYAVDWSVLTVNTERVL